jgi:hypothetical protein
MSFDLPSFLAGLILGISLMAGWAFVLARPFRRP